MNNKIIIQVVSFLIGVVIGYLILEFMIKPNIVPIKTGKKPEYIITSHTHERSYQLYCDSFQFKNPYYVEYWYKGQKLILSSKNTIAVETNENK